MVCIISNEKFQNLCAWELDTDSVMIQSYYGNHSLLGKGRLLGSKVSTIFLQTLKFNSPLRLKALTFHSLRGSLTTYNTFKDGEEIKF